MVGFLWGVMARALGWVFIHQALGLFSGALVFAASARKNNAPEFVVESLVWLGLAGCMPALSALALPYVCERAGLPWRAGFLDVAPALFMTMAGVGLAMYWLRIWVPRWNGIGAFLTKKTQLERNRKTDVREIGKFLPAATGEYEPARYVRPALGLFVGLDEHRKPVYIDYETSRIQHMLLTGRTRSGKGVAAQIVIPQQIERGEYVVVLDPKVDNWMPHAFFDACRRAGVPYRFLDLRQSAPAQCNPFAECDAETIENMLIGGFSLTEKGEAADFYRLADRRAARRCAAWLAEKRGATARDALAALGEEWCEAAPAFHSYMAEMAELESVNAREGGIDIAEGLQTGGCLYVVGDMINPRLIRMQRMILLRLLFLAKGRALSVEAQPRTISVFADEFKVHISRPFMTSLGASAGWGLHCILAFQSLQDLADCPADLDKDMVRGAVMENCAIQLSYAIKDPDTAEWLARSTGKILVDDEMRTVERNVVNAEIVRGDRRISMAERALVDVNMFMSLPKACAVLAMPGQLARFCYTSPPRTRCSAQAIAVTPAKASSAAATASDAIDPGSPATPEHAQSAGDQGLLEASGTPEAGKSGSAGLSPLDLIDV